jgi:hypothetical protein
MNYVICPEGTGEINIHMDSGEASNLLSQLNHMVEEFDWDDYLLSILRDLLNRGINDVRATGGASIQHPEDFDMPEPFSDENISRLGRQSLGGSSVAPTHEGAWRISNENGMPEYGSNIEIASGDDDPRQDR